MTHRIFKLCLFLLLGAIVNVAVAWTYAICFDIYPEQYRWIEKLGFTYDKWNGPDYTIYECRYGAPFRALYTDWVDAGAQGCPIRPGDVLEIPSPLPERYRFKSEESSLPLDILWPGFVANVVFYACLLRFLFAAPSRLRRSIRIKRGQCPACAYPIGTSDVCTECGKPVTTKSVEPAT